MTPVELSSVHIVRLEPMRMACASGFGPAPEGLAWKKLFAWLENQDLLKDPHALRFFGFNNPDPTPGSPNYGYDQWVTIPAEVLPEGDVNLIQYPGGLYAVTSSRLNVIFESWQALVVWREGSRYRPANHQWLEEVITPEVLLRPEFFTTAGDPSEVQIDLYLPIAE